MMSTQDLAWRLFPRRSTVMRISRACRIATALSVSIILSVLGGGFFAARADDSLTFTLQGVKRTATLYRPSELADGPAPVLIALHGRGQTIQSFRDALHVEAVA